MRIPIIDRISDQHLILFILGLFVAQVIEGTNPIFALLVGIYIFIWVRAMNECGGMYYVSGAFIFFNGLLTVVLGMVLKVLMLEPGDSNLLAPQLTMVCYCITVMGMYVAAILNRGLRAKTPYVEDFSSLASMKQASIAGLILAAFFSFFGGNAETAGGVITALRQLNLFPYLTVLVAVTYVIRISGGKRSLNGIAWAGILFNTAFGLLYYTKEGMLIGATCWLLAAAYNRYEFSVRQVSLLVVGFAFFNYYLVPYSQYVRTFTTSSKEANLEIALKYLADLPETRRLYLDSQEVKASDGYPHLFDGQQPFLERLIMFGFDDAVINYTDQGHVFGLEPVYDAYANIVPHFIWKDKPKGISTNRYAFELGLVAEDDLTTGISLSMAADAFHQAKWFGLIVLVPFQTFLLFIVWDSLLGSAKTSFWPMLWILAIAHLAPETGVLGSVWLVTYGLLSMAFMVWTTKYATPYVVRIFKGRKITTIARPVPVFDAAMLAVGQRAPRPQDRRP